MNDILLTPIRLSELEILIENSVKRAISNTQSKPEADRWFDIDQLCEYLPGTPSKASIYATVHNRMIPHKKMGKRLAFLKSEIDDWLKSKGRKTIQEIEAEVDNQLSKQ